MARRATPQGRRAPALDGLEPIEGSSLFQGYAYDQASGRLTVQMANGERYAYADVPIEVATAFAGAQSKGAFYGQKIRDRYASSKVT